MKWEPIETAPKDGTVVLVAPGIWGGRHCSIARYDNNKFAKKPRPFWRRDDDLGKVSYSRGTPPTHWMPLPPPPDDPRYYVTDAGRKALLPDDGC